jgi:hypothetical protein
MTVELPGGLRAWRYPVPPEDFKPLEADEATLARYGFPHRPRNRRLLDLWEKTLATPIRILEPRYEIAEGRHRTIAGLSANWSGGQIASAPGQVFSNVLGVWTVPSTYPDPNYNGQSVCSCWIGISDANNHLLQAGVECDVANKPDGRSTYAWWTMFPSPEIPINVPVSPGDSILCAIGAAPPSEKDHSRLLIHIWFANLSRGLATIIPAQVGYFAPTNAEWIVERTAAAPYPPPPYMPKGPLARYGKVVFTDCSAVALASKDPTDLTGGDSIFMTDVNDVYFISTGEIIDSSTVACSWVAYE